MNWRGRLPRSRDFDTTEEYEEALNAYYDALEADYEERMCNRED